MSHPGVKKYGIYFFLEIFSISIVDLYEIIVCLIIKLCHTMSWIICCTSHHNFM